MGAIDALLAGPLAAMTVGGVVFAGLGAACARLWLGEQPPEVDARKLPPLTLLRPVKPGVPSLREKLETLAQAMRPGDQLVLGADEGSPEFAVCEAVRAAFSDREIVVVACAPGAAVNPKIAKLVQMDAHTRHEHLLLSDSEALIDGAWLDPFRSEWTASSTDVLTAPYRFVGFATPPQRADAVAMLLSFWPGLALVRALGPVQFPLGACTGLRRADLAAVRGWAAFCQFRAEDNRLGQLSRNGTRGFGSARRWRLSRRSAGLARLLAAPAPGRGHLSRLRSTWFCRADCDARDQRRHFDRVAGADERFAGFLAALGDCYPGRPLVRDLGAGEGGAHGDSGPLARAGCGGSGGGGLLGSELVRSRDLVGWRRAGGGGRRADKRCAIEQRVSFVWKGLGNHYRFSLSETARTTPLKLNYLFTTLTIRPPAVVSRASRPSVPGPAL